jgi:hypothetical protein
MPTAPAPWIPVPGGARHCCRTHEPAWWYKTPPPLESAVVNALAKAQSTSLFARRHYLRSR